MKFLGKKGLMDKFIDLMKLKEEKYDDEFDEEFEEKFNRKTFDKVDTDRYETKSSQIENESTRRIDNEDIIIPDFLLNKLSRKESTKERDEQANDSNDEEKVNSQIKSRVPEIKYDIPEDLKNIMKDIDPEKMNISSQEELDKYFDRCKEMTDVLAKQHRVTREKVNSKIKSQVPEIKYDIPEDLKNIMKNPEKMNISSQEVLDKSFDTYKKMTEVLAKQSKDTREKGQKFIDNVKQEAESIVEKANADAKKIIEDAKKQADQILREAQIKANKIDKETTREAKKSSRNLVLDKKSDSNSTNKKKTAEFRERVVEQSKKYDPTVESIIRASEEEIRKQNRELASKMLKEGRF